MHMGNGGLCVGVLLEHDVRSSPIVDDYIVSRAWLAQRSDWTYSVC